MAGGSVRPCFVPGWSWGQSETQRSPFPFPLGHSPGFRASCLLAKESRWESPGWALALTLAGHQHPGLPARTGASPLPQPSCPLQEWPEETEAEPGARLPGWTPCYCSVSVWPWAGHLPPALSVSSQNCHGAQRKNLVLCLPPSVCAASSKDGYQKGEGEE